MFKVEEVLTFAGFASHDDGRIQWQKALDNEVRVWVFFEDKEHTEEESVHNVHIFTTADQIWGLPDVEEDIDIHIKDASITTFMHVLQGVVRGAENLPQA